ncbi:DNA-binding response regulator [Glutamicibacter sp. NPDC087344]|uniref:response regulator transcription factor n=1 Tax=Glutamicibacter sp. NPDC087344 TaxID=3363994 RepID=UPI00382335B9
MRIALAEDNVLLLDGLLSLLERRGHEIVVQAQDGTQLLTQFQALHKEGTRPDLVISDVRMPPTHTDEGLRAILAIRQVYPLQPVLLFSQWVETRFATQLLGNDPRGVGYLLKDRVTDVKEFLLSLRRVAEGQTVLDPDVVAQLMGGPVPAQSSATPAYGAQLNKLTGREREVLELMARGLNNTEIASALTISYGAVEKNVAAIFLKLDLPPEASGHRRVKAVLAYLQG